ncbi:MAG: hypothetical protein IJF33_05830, partial [Clostridia bacterium]|nr:hypothetical protein [Clostridia bacterium]
TKHVDAEGNGKFQFYVNNQKIYVNGTNWKPLSPLHSEADALVEKALGLVDDLYCNMVRVWGGGIYEGKEFFDYCDTHGILVWQDFMFGCEIPPNEENYLKLCREETINVIKRIRNHPSLAVFCGDNENDMFLSNRFRGQVPPSCVKLTREVLPNCVYSYAPTIPYVESSPVCSDEAAKDIATGSTKLVGSEAHFYRNIKLNYEGIRACRSLFIGETGPIGTNPFTDNPRIYEREKARLERLWNTPSPMTMIDMHQHDSYLINKLRYGADICKIWFDKEFTFRQYFDFAFGVGVICSNLFKDIIELCRVSRWDKTGVIWWSLLDMWPMICNYSVVDCDFRPKLPYYSIKQAQQPFALAAVRKKVGGEMALYYANDTLETHNVSFKITAHTAEGNSYEVASGSCEMKPNEAEKVLPLPATEKTELWLIEWQENGKTYHNHIFTSDQHADFDAYRKWYDMLKPLYGIQ